MVDVRFELTTNYQVLPSTPFVKVLVRWAKSKRLTNRLPVLSLITPTIEVHPLFSEAPNFRSSIIPHTSPDVSLEQKSNFIPIDIPMAQVLKSVIFRKTIGLPTILG